MTSVPGFQSTHKDPIVLKALKGHKEMVTKAVFRPSPDDEVAREGTTPDDLLRTKKDGRPQLLWRLLQCAGSLH